MPFPLLQVYRGVRKRGTTRSCRSSPSNHCCQQQRSSIAVSTSVILPRTVGFYLILTVDKRGPDFQHEQPKPLLHYQRLLLLLSFRLDLLSATKAWKPIGDRRRMNPHLHCFRSIPSPIHPMLPPEIMLYQLLDLATPVPLIVIFKSK
ncbi:unnamed protein product [Lactuca saligna]|uniref:Uncharacterized protein n=1 Tax=Lactuca saligna TaxID=75948 RepID=A0AA35YNT4_LACSI|nr:unnamed protein product [Lactuca saligna]